MSDGRSSTQLKKFVFRSKAIPNGEYRGDHLEIVIPELLLAGYSFYTWPSAPVLAWFLWDQRNCLAGKRILELGSGTSLPGILAAKCGASVTLTDSFTLSKSLQHISRCCEANGLTPGQDIKLVGLTWGLFLGDIFDIGPQDIIISSDCFYEPTVFEDILVTVSYFLENSNAKFLCTYQERSSDWSIEALLKKWNLKCSLIDLDSVGEVSGINYQELMGDHTIHLLEITSV